MTASLAPEERHHMPDNNIVTPDIGWCGVTQIYTGYKLDKHSGVGGLGNLDTNYPVDYILMKRAYILLLLKF